MSALNRARRTMLIFAFAAALLPLRAQEALDDAAPNSAIASAEAPSVRAPKKAFETPQRPADKSPEKASAKAPPQKTEEQAADGGAKTAPKKPAAARLVVGDPPAPDDYALRYYASQRQMARVNSELLRLKRLYPNYEPPRDLYEKPGNGGADEEELWRLFASDKVDEMRAYIAQKQRMTPDWKPSADLSTKLRRKELRLKIAAFFKAEKFLDLVDYIKGENVDLDELSEDIDVVWTIAEAYARAKQHEEAVATFKRVLTTSKDAHIRRATVQKAMAAMRMADVETLLASVEGGSEVAGDFAPLLIDITRARIAAWLHDERARRPTPEEIEKFEIYARDSRDANQIGLVAWYYFKRRETDRAFEWFKLAIEKDGDATIAHGLAHTLQRLGRAREAEEVAYAWRETLANNFILFLDILGADLMREVPPYIETARLARYAQATMEVASGEGAQALAWYAFSSCQFDVALTWFCLLYTS
ncbi:MAG: hypothetical protein N2444_09000, partial [Methylocystis sp.]|nr:hypothetical protein [Methylocystis sp.]